MVKAVRNLKIGDAFYELETRKEEKVHITKHRAVRLELDDNDQIKVYSNKWHKHTFKTFDKDTISYSRFCFDKEIAKGEYEKLVKELLARREAQLPKLVIEHVQTTEKIRLSKFEE